MELFTVIALAVAFVLLAAAAVINQERYSRLIATGLGAWVLVSLVVAVRALN